MSRGDELLAGRQRMLVYLYDRGAVGLSTAADYGDLLQGLGLDQVDLDALIESMEEAGLLKVSGAAVKFEGTSYSPALFWLTESGFAQAAHLARGPADKGTAQTRRRIGFPEPGQAEGET